MRLRALSLVYSLTLPILTRFPRLLALGVFTMTTIRVTNKYSLRVIFRA